MDEISLRGINIFSSDSPPPCPKDGDMFYNTDREEYSLYVNGQWATLVMQKTADLPSIVEQLTPKKIIKYKPKFKGSRHTIASDEI